MKLNSDGINLMHLYEGLRLEAYLCPAKVWTIGYGNTFYEDGTKVKQGDKITKERAYELFHNIVRQKFEGKVKSLLKVELNDNQYSALICFAYNVGIGRKEKGVYINGFGGSTLLKKVNKNPKDPFIREEFLKWNKAGGKALLGLTRRRTAEANLYFKI